MSVTFIGDVHGQYRQLQELLPQCCGEIIFVGDLIDRGPDSRLVIDCVAELCQQGKARCVLGNHEYQLLRGLGVPERGIPRDDGYNGMWWHYGGQEMAASFNVAPFDDDGLRKALDWRLLWLADLPWFLTGTVHEHRFIVVHACLELGRSTAEQLEELQDPTHLWMAVEQPHCLYGRTMPTPKDFPADTVLVSGHTVMEQVVYTSDRICCDTSGGRGFGPLSGIQWPTGTVIAAW